MSNESLDQVRERIRRAQEQEAEALENHPAKQELQEWRRQRDEEKRREEEQREQERERARSEGRAAEIESLKTELRNNFLGSGGSSEEFERVWPDLKAQELSRRTLEGAERVRRQTSAYYRETF
jgi:hypothetical protein